VELCPRIGFIVKNSSLPAGKVIKVYNGAGDVENRMKQFSGDERGGENG
jgi:hypothetical protein